MSRDVDILQAEALTACPWLNLYRVTYSRGGERRTWQIASRHSPPRCVTGRFERPDAVVIAAVHRPRNRLVLTREYRVGLAGFEIGFPAGLVEAGEAVEAAARRELREETGLELVRVSGTSPPLYSSAGMTDESVALVFAECEGEPSAAGAEPHEVIEVMLASPAEVGRLCADPALKFDAKAWLVMTRYAATGRL